MTLIEASNLLIKYFTNNSVFYLDRDFKKVVLISEDEDNDKASILGGLQKLIEIGILKKVEVPASKGYKAYYCLDKELNFIPQTVSVSFETANEIVEVINKTAEKYGIKERADVLNVSEKDIKALLILIGSSFQVINELTQLVNKNNDNDI